MAKRPTHEQGDVAAAPPTWNVIADIMYQVCQWAHGGVGWGVSPNDAATKVVELYVPALAAARAQGARERNKTHSATFTLFGVELRCHVLSDGQRAVDAESFEDFMAMMAAVPHAGTEADRAELERFVRWQRGAE